MDDIYYFFLAAGLLSFLIIFLIFRRKKIETPLRKLKFWIIWLVTTFILGIVAVVTVLFIFIVSVADYIPPTKPFNQKAWLSNPHKRVEMIDDLLKRKLLDKKTKIEIIRLLGQPVDSVDTTMTIKTDYLEYYLGSERGINSVDSEWLDINFTTDTVENYGLHTD